MDFDSFDYFDAVSIIFCAMMIISLSWAFSFSLFSFFADAIISLLFSFSFDVIISLWGRSSLFRLLSFLRLHLPLIFIFRYYYFHYFLFSSADYHLLLPWCIFFFCAIFMPLSFSLARHYWLFHYHDDYYFSSRFLFLRYAAISLMWAESFIFFISFITMLS